MTHCKYNIRFNGILGVDLGVEQKTIDDDRWDTIVPFYTKHIQAWRDNMAKRQPLVIFRLEYEPPADSIVYPQFYKPEGERFYLERFADWLTSHSIPYHIVWLTRNAKDASYDPVKKIATLPYKTPKAGDILNGDQLLSHIKKHAGFVLSTLAKSIPPPLQT
jgi:hypothetical protein